MTSTEKKLLAAAFLLVFDLTAVAFAKRGKLGTADILDEQGRVLLTEYSDYQCPACRVAAPVVRSLQKAYGEKLHWVHRHYPLEMHKWARVASLAVECASQQGQFDAFHDKIFETQDQWSTSMDARKDFLALAKTLKLDVAGLNACMDAPETAKKVDADRQDGNTRAVQSTPTFFVAGERLAGRKQLETRGPMLIERVLREHK